MKRASAAFALFLATWAAPAAAEPLALASVTTPRIAAAEAAGLLDTGAIPMAGVVVGTALIVGGLWTPNRRRR